jgi:glucose-6-phosphate 1-dehydrogenase
MSQNLAESFQQQPYQRAHSDLTEQQLLKIDDYLQKALTQNSTQLRKTHLFHGRYENIYIDEPQCNDLQLLMNEAVQRAASIIGVNAEELSIGYWFNLMNPGDITDWHTHDDDDELLSGVVYLKVPKDSGNLVIREQTDVELEPRLGGYVFFLPSTPHVVTENHSPEHRLSIGMNFGLKANKH